MKVRSVQFQHPTEVVNQPHLTQVSSGMVRIEDLPKSRMLVIRSLDEQVNGYTVVPYENVKAIRYVEDE